jgi:hypothetical protein
MYGQFYNIDNAILLSTDGTEFDPKEKALTALALRSLANHFILNRANNKKQINLVSVFFLFYEFANFSSETLNYNKKQINLVSHFHIKSLRTSVWKLEKNVQQLEAHRSGL